MYFNTGSNGSIFWYSIYIETTRLLKEDSVKSTSELESRLKKTNIPYKIEILEVRSITNSLVSYAESHNVDLIVMGSRGFSGFKKLLLGSVASGVSQHSKCPVLIIK
jgi:nucleotide-binding universal stress UspA family protein